MGIAARWLAARAYTRQSNSVKIRKKAKKSRTPAAPPILPNSGRDLKRPQIDSLYAKVGALRPVDDESIDPPKTES